MPGLRCRVTPLRFLLILSVAGCQESEPTDTEPLPTWTVDPSPTVSIGGLAAAEDDALYGVFAASRLDDGRTLVVTRSDSRIRYFGPDGSFLRSVGGYGDGPGELGMLMAAIRGRNDRLFALSRDSRLTTYSIEGDFLQSRRVSLLGQSEYPCRFGVRNWMLLPDGAGLSVFVETLGDRGCPQAPARIYRPSALVVRQDFDTGRVDTLAFLAGPERNGSAYRVFGRSWVAAAGPDGVFLADTGAEEILHIGPDGDTLDILSNPLPEVPIPDSAKEIEARTFRRPGGEEYVGDPYDYPDTYPRIARMLSDRLGHLWIMAYPRSQLPLAAWHLVDPQMSYVQREEGSNWIVIEPRRGAIARVRIPPGLFPLEIGQDYVLGVSQDEFNVESVVLHTLYRQ